MFIWLYLKRVAKVGVREGVTVKIRHFIGLLRPFQSEIRRGVDGDLWVNAAAVARLGIRNRKMAEPEMTWCSGSPLQILLRFLNSYYSILSIIYLC